MATECDDLKKAEKFRLQVLGEAIMSPEDWLGTCGNSPHMTSPEVLVYTFQAASVCLNRVWTSEFESEVALPMEI